MLDIRLFCISRPEVCLRSGLSRTDSFLFCPFLVLGCLEEFRKVHLSLPIYVSKLAIFIQEVS